MLPLTMSLEHRYSLLCNNDNPNNDIRNTEANIVCVELCNSFTKDHFNSPVNDKDDGDFDIPTNNEDEGQYDISINNRDNIPLSSMARSTKRIVVGSS